MWMERLFGKSINKTEHKLKKEGLIAKWASLNFFIKKKLDNKNYICSFTRLIKIGVTDKFWILERLYNDRVINIFCRVMEKLIKKHSYILVIDSNKYINFKFPSS